MDTNAGTPGILYHGNPLHFTFCFQFVSSFSANPSAHEAPNCLMNCIALLVPHHFCAGRAAGDTVAASCRGHIHLQEKNAWGYFGL